MTLLILFSFFLVFFWREWGFREKTSVKTVSPGVDTLCVLQTVSWI